MKLTSNHIIAQIITIIFILLFAYTGFSKLIEHKKFMETLSRVPLLQSVASFTAYAIPAVELGTAALLIFPSAKYIAWYASLILMGGFTLFIAAMLLSGSRLPCTCGGVIASMTWKQHLVFNIFFTTLAAIQLAREKKEHQQNHYA